MLATALSVRWEELCPRIILMRSACGRFRPRIQTRRKYGAQRASGHGHQLPDVEKSFQRRSRHRWQNPVHERRPAHHHWSGAGKFHGTFIGSRSTSGCRRRCRRRSITQVTNSRTAARAGLKAPAFLNQASRDSKERPNFPRSRNDLRTIFRKQIAATASKSSRSGKRRSTGPPEFRRRSASPQPSFSLSSSSLAPT